MAYTTAQLAEIRQAIVDLAAGKRVTTITRQGRTVQYGVADLGALRHLEQTMADSLQEGGKRSRTRQTVTSKGL